MRADPFVCLILELGAESAVLLAIGVPVGVLRGVTFGVLFRVVISSKIHSKLRITFAFVTCTTLE